MQDINEIQDFVKTLASAEPYRPANSMPVQTTALADLFCQWPFAHAPRLRDAALRCTVDRASRADAELLVGDVVHAALTRAAIGA